MVKYFFMNACFFIFACSDSKKNNDNSASIYCPLTNFSYDRNRKEVHYFEAEPTPCDKEPHFKKMLFAIDEKGNGIIEFEGKEIRLKPSKAVLNKKTVLWSQLFVNDSIKLTIFLDNYELVQNWRTYVYNSKLSVNVKDSIYTYEMKGICDSIAVNRL